MYYIIVRKKNVFPILGIGLGLIYLPAIVSVTYYFEKRRAFATGLAVCGSGLGTFIFAPLSKILVETYTWKGAVLIEAGLLLNCIVCGALFRPLEMETKKVTVDSDDEEPVANGRIYTGSEHPKMNGHIPTVIVHSDTDEETPTANGGPLNLPLLKIKSEVSASAHSLPFQDLNSPRKAEANNLRRHASDNMLHKKTKRRRTYTNTCQKSEDNSHKARPMARKDIFYTSSLHNIPMYRSNPNMYTRSILSLPDASSDEDLTTSCSCLPNFLRCSPEMKDAFRQMMDFSLLKNPLFLMFAISNLFTSIGFCVPYTFSTRESHFTRNPRKQSCLPHCCDWDRKHGGACRVRLAVRQTICEQALVVQHCAYPVWNLYSSECILHNIRVACCICCFIWCVHR